MTECDAALFVCCEKKKLLLVFEFVLRYVPRIPTSAIAVKRRSGPETSITISTADHVHVLHTRFTVRVLTAFDIGGERLCNVSSG